MEASSEAFGEFVQSGSQAGSVLALRRAILHGRLLESRWQVWGSGFISAQRSRVKGALGSCGSVVQVLYFRKGKLASC